LKTQKLKIVEENTKLIDYLNREKRSHITTISRMNEDKDKAILEKVRKFREKQIIDHMGNVKIIQTDIALMENFFIEQ